MARADAGERLRRSARSRSDVHLVRLDPTLGSELRKTRPCVVVSPDEMNHALRTVIMAPLATGGRPYPSRVATSFQDIEGYAVLDQIRTVDRGRLVRRLGVLDGDAAQRVLDVLTEMFAG